MMRRWWLWRLLLLMTTTSSLVFSWLLFVRERLPCSLLHPLPLGTHLHPTQQVITHPFQQVLYLSHPSSSTHPTPPGSYSLQPFQQVLTPPLPAGTHPTPPSRYSPRPQQRYSPHDYPTLPAGTHPNSSHRLLSTSQNKNNY